MKVGLIIPANIKYSPYVQYYVQVLDRLKIEYKTIAWKKVDIEESIDFPFNYACSDSQRKKIFLGHFLFARHCRKIVRRENFDKLVIFTIAPVFFLGSLFLKKYKNQFIFDIRDDSPFRRKFSSKLKVICKMANVVVVSSDNFSPWTGCNTILCHNADSMLIKKYYNLPVKKSIGDTKSIVFAGSMNEAEINIQVISALKNNNSFSLGFIGKPNAEKQKIEDYVKKNNITNVWFEGTYKKEEIVDKYQDSADIINIIRKENTINKNALPNKLYDAVVSAIPLIVFEHNEAIANYVKEYNLGIILQEVDLSCLPEAIENKMNTFNFDLYEEGRKKFLQKVLDDQQLFESMVSLFVGTKNG